MADGWWLNAYYYTSLYKNATEKVHYISGSAVAMWTISRKVEFEASHFYCLPHLSEAENRARFGKAALPHGHNFVLHISVRGEIEPQTGWLINIQDLDAILHERIISQFDHQCINLDHPVFRDRLPTTENLVVYIWHELEGQIPRCQLRGVRLYESDWLFSEYRGERARNIEGKEVPMVYFTRAYEFNASHRLHNPNLSEEENCRLYGKCNSPHGHGHNYRLEVTVVGELDEQTGMIVALNWLDSVVQKEVLDRLDYKYLNTDVELFQKVNPTTENIVKFIYECLAPRLTGKSHLHRVRLYETPRSWFDYGAPD